MRFSITKVCLGLTVLLATAASSVAAENTYLCSISDVYECADVTGCSRISLETANLAAVMVLDVENKKLKSAPLGQAPRAADVDSLTVMDNLILLHGIGKNAPTPRAFSALIDMETGKLSAGVSTPDASLAITGKCTAQP